MNVHGISHTHAQASDILGFSLTWTEKLRTLKFDLTGIQTHDLYITTGHFMSLRCVRQSGVNYTKSTHVSAFFGKSVLKCHLT